MTYTVKSGSTASVSFPNPSYSRQSTVTFTGSITFAENMKVTGGSLNPPGRLSWSASAFRIAL